MNKGEAARLWTRDSNPSWKTQNSSFGLKAGLICDAIKQNKVVCQRM